MDDRAPLPNVQGPTAGSRHRKYGLVLSGGGLRFAVHAGVLSVMSEWFMDGRPWLDQVEVLVGTSAGALYSALYAAGYTPAHIAAFAVLFAEPELGGSLYNWNFDRAAAAFLRHDISYVRGLTSGFGVLSLFETIFSKSVRDLLLNDYPDPDVIARDEKKKQRAVKQIAACWKKRRDARRDDSYYQDEDLLTFDDCTKELYLLGVNALTGQKTVFCRVPGEKEGTDQDKLKADLWPAVYINEDESKAALAEITEGLHLVWPLEFKRFANRVYRDFDRTVYCRAGRANAQLPLALAVRSSASMPIFFEPCKIRHQPLEFTRADSPRNPKPYDLFFDGGVVDNFSLSVAADPQLGKCTHILGVFLGNLGYRLPNPDAVGNIASLSMSTVNYMGDGLQDWEMLAASLEDHFITVINALPTLAAEMTETEKIPPLLDESRKIAQQFWIKLTGAKEYPTGRPVPIERERLFSSMGKQRIYLSEAARSGPASFPKFIRGEAELADPRPLDVLTRLPLLLPLTSKDPLSRWWRVGYALLFLVSFGLITLISDLLGEPTGLSPAVRLWLSTNGGPSWGWVILRLVLAIVVVLLVRVWAYVVWALMQRKTVFGT